MTNKEQENIDFFKPIEKGLDVGLETDLLNLEYDLANMSVSLEDINTISIQQDNIPLGLEVSYEGDAIVPKVKFEFSDNEIAKGDVKSIVDSALEEYERNLGEDL